MTDKPKKRRPKLSLRAPATVLPGEPFSATVVLNTRAPVDVQWVKATLVGLQRASIGSGNARSSKHRTVCQLEAELCGARQLPKGQTELRCRMVIPAGAPPSYHTTDASVQYVVSVRVSIAWWPDAKGEYELQVGLGEPAAEYPGTRRLIASTEQPEGNKPYMEASLAQDVFAPGDVVTGSVALSNVGKNRFRGLEVHLEGTEEVRFPNGRSGSSKRTDLRYSIPLDPEEGASYDFRIKLPDAMAPTHDAGLWRLGYTLMVLANRRWGRDVPIIVPVTIVPRRFRVAAAPERSAPPTVGSERVDAIWRSVGQQHDLVFEDEELSGTVAGVAVRIARDHRGREGTFMVALLEYPALELDVSIQRGGGWGRGARDGVAIGIARWDRRHRVEVRDRQQSAGFFESLAPLLGGFRTVRMTDTEATLEAKGAGTQPRRVAQFVDKVVAFAEALADARRALPPPPIMANQVDAWTELAEALRGTLAHVPMEVRGTVGGLSALVRTEWAAGGEPLHTVVAVQPPVPLEAAYAWEATAPIDVQQAHALDRDSRHILASVCKDADQVRIAHDAVSVHLEAPLRDPAAVVARLTAMSRLVQALAPSSGPYR